MKWGAHEIDGRLAAYNAIKIRAALRQSINATMIYQAYLNTQPYKSDNVTQDRAKARAWAIINVSFNNEAITEILRNVWAEAYVLGESSALDAVRQAKELKKVDAVVDWSKWKAGSEAKELLVRPKGSFKKILSEANITIRNLNRVGYEKIGNALADSFALGLSASSSAKLILNTIADPARALTIAITENSRVQNLAAIDTYKELGLEKYEWSAADPCEICAENDGQIVTMDEVFDSGDEAPPAHPNCRCVLLPVVDGMEESGGSSIEQFDELTTDIDEQGVARIDPSAVNEAGVTDTLSKPEFAKPTEYGPKEHSRLLARQEKRGDMDADLRFASQEWQGDSYKQIQSGLTGKGGVRGLSQRIGEIVDILDSHMNNLPLDTELYRGQTTGFSGLKIGDKFKSKLYQATTTDPISAAGFSKSSGSVLGGVREGDTATIFRITTQSNVKGVIMDGDEYEVVLARGTKFEVEFVGEEIINGVKLKVIDLIATASK